MTYPVSSGGPKPYYGSQAAPRHQSAGAYRAPSAPVYRGGGDTYISSRPLYAPPAHEGYRRPVVIVASEAERPTQVEAPKKKKKGGGIGGFFKKLLDPAGVFTGDGPLGGLLGGGKARGASDDSGSAGNAGTSKKAEVASDAEGASESKSSGGGLSRILDPLGLFSGDGLLGGLLGGGGKKSGGGGGGLLGGLLGGGGGGGLGGILGIASKFFF